MLLICTSKFYIVSIFYEVGLGFGVRVGAGVGPGIGVGVCTRVSNGGLQEKELNQCNHCIIHSNKIQKVVDSCNRKGIQLTGVSSSSFRTRNVSCLITMLTPLVVV